jgi:hypothetical protein
MNAALPSEEALPQFIYPAGTRGDAPQPRDDNSPFHRTLRAR